MGEEIVSRIKAPLLATRHEPVAASLALLLAWRGDPAAVRAVAVELATNARRRVLILLLVRLMVGRHTQAAQEIAAMLPAGHPASAWALGGDMPAPNDGMVADLGEPGICEQVLTYLGVAD